MYINKLVILTLVIFDISLTKGDSYDWRDHGAVLPVPDQRNKVDASVINVLDSISAKKYIVKNELISLSRQQIYDCQSKWCPGTSTPVNPYELFAWLMNGMALDSEASYPTTGQCKHECNKNATAVSSLSGWSSTGHGDQEDVLKTFISNSPPVVEVNVNTSAWMTYSGGILDDPNCHNTMDAMNHNLLLVGYGTQNGTDYWIARNSSGEEWGEKGYVRIVQHKNMCGIGNRVAQPVFVG